ncbi:MAG: hypothetical protein ACPGVT_11650 [Maricaulaceae bacterium]
MQPPQKVRLAQSTRLKAITVIAPRKFVARLTVIAFQAVPCLIAVMRIIAGITPEPTAHVIQTGITIAVIDQGRTTITDIEIGIMDVTIATATHGRVTVIVIGAAPAATVVATIVAA